MIILHEIRLYITDVWEHLYDAFLNAPYNNISSLSFFLQISTSVKGLMSVIMFVTTTLGHTLVVAERVIN